QHIIAWDCGSMVRPRFLLSVLYAMKPEIYRITMGSTIPTIGMPDVRRMALAVPPLAEQDAIAQHVEDGCLRLDETVEKVRTQVGTVREYRQALISAAVTGKIDVAKEAA
ncbi:MAG: restriction endonuclease subunit S, partial [Myxococcota bacterium]